MQTWPHYLPSDLAGTDLHGLLDLIAPRGYQPKVGAADSAETGFMAILFFTHTFCLERICMVAFFPVAWAKCTRQQARLAHHLFIKLLKKLRCFSSLIQNKQQEQQRNSVTWKDLSIPCRGYNCCQLKERVLKHIRFHKIKISWSTKLHDWTAFIKMS